MNFNANANLDQNYSSSLDCHLPAISNKDVGINLFSAMTPGTDGLPVKRFQEIIDSEIDETKFGTKNAESGLFVVNLGG